MLWFLASLALAATDAPGDAMLERHWDLQHLHLDLTIDPDDRRIEGTATHTVTPIGAPHGFLRLHQVGLEISAVTVDGAPVEWLQRPRHLDIPVEGGVSHTVVIAYATHPETGVHFRDRTEGGRRIVEAWTQGEDVDNRHWFPGWDTPNDTFTVSQDLRAPSELVVVANGIRGATTEADGWTTWSYSLEQPIVNYLVAFAAGDYAIYTDESSVPLEYVAASTVDESLVRASASGVREMLPFFETLLDEPYPYPVYRQVYVQRFLYGGMENASITVLADRLLQSPGVAHRYGGESVVAHELAHQWFGDLLTCYGWRELWLNEGFATYYAGRWMAENHGEEVFAASLKRWARPARRTSRPMAARGWSKVDERPNTDVYTRGATVLHMLRVWLGDDVFDQGIANYVSANRHRLVESDDLRRALEDASGQHLGWFFDRWVHGYGAPELSSSHSSKEGTVTVTVKQSTEDPYLGPVEIVVGLTGGGETREVVWLTGGATRASFPTPDGADWVSVDPRGGLLAEWSREQAPEQWIAQLASASDPYARLTAIDALGKGEGTEDVIAALSAAVMGHTRASSKRDEDPQVLAREAAAALGELGTPDAVETLRKALLRADAGPTLREAIYGALADTAFDPITRGRLKVAVQADPDPFARAAALQALTGQDPAAGAAAARTMLSRSDTTMDQSQHEAALDVLSEHGTASDLSRALSRLAHPLRSVQWSAGATAVALADDASSSQRRNLRKGLEAWLDHSDLRLRKAAIGLLRTLGDDDAVGALKAFAARTRLERHRTSARDAIEALRRPSSPDDPDTERATLAAIESLREELEELTERLESLEDQ